MAPNYFLSSVLQCLNSIVEKTFLLLGKKVMNNCAQVIIAATLAPWCLAEGIFPVEEYVLAKWSQIRGIRDSNQQIQSHSYTQQPLRPKTCVMEDYPDETRLLSSVFLSVSP